MIQKKEGAVLSQEVQDPSPLPIRLQPLTPVSRKFTATG